MTKLPLVSVHMLTYNHAPFIVKAIEGVLCQETNFRFELIIGEDCSIDGTQEIVLDYQTKYPDIIRVITSDKNVGGKQNAYRTMKACRGKYIAYCDGDDFWHNPLKLQKQVDYLEAHPACGLVYSSYDVYHVKSNKTIRDFTKLRKLTIPERPSISDVVGGTCALLTCTVMARRHLCEQLIEADTFLHKSDHFLMGDTQLWAEMATIAYLHYIPESFATHVITEESATRSKDIKKVLRFSISNGEVLQYLCDKYSLPKALKAQAENYIDGASLRLAFHSRNSEIAEMVRNRRNALTLKEWILYYGSKNIVFHYCCRAIVLSYNLFRKTKKPWM